MHALLKIGDSFLMLNDEFPEFGGTAAPATESSDTLHIYIENVDSAFEKRLRLGQGEDAGKWRCSGRPLRGK